MDQTVTRYFADLAGAREGVVATVDHGRPIGLGEAFSRVIAQFDAVVRGGGKVMFIGNGGSAGIASHAAIDYLKNGGIPAMAFNDGAALTCLGNDLGYGSVFAGQIAALGRSGDLLMAVSSSGASPSILNAVDAARRIGCSVVGFSGFSPDNPLRSLGDVNFYVPSSRYGFVEILHLTLIHALLDLRAEENRLREGELQAVRP